MAWGARDISELAETLWHDADRDEEAHSAARGGGARHDGEGRPYPQTRARALRIRGHQHVAAATRPLRAGRRTDERSTMSTPTNKSTKKDKKSTGFTDDERAAMKARAQELKAEARANKNRAEGERDVLAAIAAMKEPDRAMAKRLHAIVKKARRTSGRRPGTGCPPMPRTARSSASSRVRGSSNRGTRRSASRKRRTSTKAPCGRPPSH